MPLYEALSPRYSKSDDSPYSYLAAFSVGLSIPLLLTCLLVIVAWRRDVSKAKSEKKEILNSLTLTKQKLAEAIELHEKQRKDIQRLHRIGSRYVLEHGPLQITAEVEQVPEDGDRVPEGNPPPEDGDAFVVSDEEEWDSDTPARHSLVSAASTVETDPAAPRIATTGVMPTAAHLSGEAARSGAGTAA
ncbi:hypothetical protein CGRA01v4_04730 [Colletotrichum graminicola]|uniref:Uncharacterized protein n=1 Tax=Colletotrichum graminicola (strain M1.001 / M2 / FGSC 10212) TaxID=645133 RepID=E3QLH7_COLGM|nr:uncharacterized protein GLRG_06690 [Colletotrichum graminicola M1.001]EFQ31715.1 hypothetical protein GLRG_06690 [Colletotrichum graminicola M1.001]WDK13449.1 hypothetical protein CGRA01v4_04730 [Colletotrichum graminicola]